MKVLWFANTPCGAAEKIAPNLHIGGWLNSLEQQLVLRSDIELSVCFYWKFPLNSFKHKSTNYYPIHRNKITRSIFRLFGHLDDKNEVMKLLQVIEEVKPDIIHVHGTEENFGLIQQYTKIPVVISLQGILLPYSEKFFVGIPFSAAYFHEGLMPKLKYNSILLAYNRMKKCATRESEILSQARFVLGRTDWDKRVNSVLAPNSQYFIGNEILRPQFYERLWDKKHFENEIQLVTTMSGGLYKGLETLIKTAKILNDHKGFNFKWTIIGQTESSALVKIIKGWLKIDFKSNNIHFVGGKSESELVNILLMSDIYIQVSHIENSPNSVGEAMLIGMPIIASFAGGTDSMVENRKEGLLVQDGDCYSLAGAILELARDFPLAAELAISANKRAKERHNKIVIENELFALYEQIKLK